MVVSRWAPTHTTNLQCECCVQTVLTSSFALRVFRVKPSIDSSYERFIVSPSDPFFWYPSFRQSEAIQVHGEASVVERYPAQASTCMLTHSRGGKRPLARHSAAGTVLTLARVCRDPGSRYRENPTLKQSMLVLARRNDLTPANTA